MCIYMLVYFIFYKNNVVYYKKWIVKMKKKVFDSKFSRLLLKLYEICYYGSNIFDGFSLGKYI